ncbi:hypothetical protein NXW94_14890 [Bacteroides ovatus]|nr:hypothetical protein [Bacteroides ovatus]
MIFRAGFPEAVENSRMMDYSIYPEYPFSLQFFSRGCIRKMPFLPRP